MCGSGTNGRRHGATADFPLAKSRGRRRFLWHAADDAINGLETVADRTERREGSHDGPVAVVLPLSADSLPLHNRNFQLLRRELFTAFRLAWSGRIFQVLVFECIVALLSPRFHPKFSLLGRFFCSVSFRCISLGRATFLLPCCPRSFAFPCRLA